MYGHSERTPCRRRTYKLVTGGSVLLNVFEMSIIQRKVNIPKPKFWISLKGFSVLRNILYDKIQ